MAGTKMTLVRNSPVTLDWDVEEIIVDQDFIDANGLVIPIEHTYEPNKNLLEVHFRGQFLHSGGGYEEIDDHHIRLDLGVDENGDPFALEVGDEIHIKVFKNQYVNRGGITVSGTDITEIKRDIYDVRRYLEMENITDIAETINKRFQALREEFQYDEFGNYEVNYEYNSLNKIEKEIVTKDGGTTRVFEYNAQGKISKESYTKGGQTVQKEYIYDAVTGKVKNVKVTTS